MKEDIFKKCLVIGTIIMFLGAGAVSALSSNLNPISKNISLGNTLYVGGPGNYRHIQDAINDADDGDTVFVYDTDSPYGENLVVNRSIILKGENRDTTVIDGDGRYGNVVIISSSEVKIESFTIQRSYDCRAGITLCESNYVTISNNIIVDNFWGIELNNSHFNRIIGNIIRENQVVGIMSYNSANGNIIRDNDIIYNGKYDDPSMGIALGISHSNHILNNNISNNDIGIEFFHNNRNNIVGNTFSENRQYGIYLQHSKNNKMISNDFVDNAVDVYFINNNIFHNNFYLRNYWNESLTKPKIIYGVVGELFTSGNKWINFDFLPRSQPK